MFKQGDRGLGYYRGSPWAGGAATLERHELCQRACLVLRTCPATHERTQTPCFDSIATPKYCRRRARNRWHFRR